MAIRSRHFLSHGRPVPGPPSWSWDQRKRRWVFFAESVWLFNQLVLSHDQPRNDFPACGNLSVGPLLPTCTIHLASTRWATRDARSKSGRRVWCTNQHESRSNRSSGWGQVDRARGQNRANRQVTTSRKVVPRLIKAKYQFIDESYWLGAENPTSLSLDSGPWRWAWYKPTITTKTANRNCHCTIGSDRWNSALSSAIWVLRLSWGEKKEQKRHNKAQKESINWSNTKTLTSFWWKPFWFSVGSKQADAQCPKQRQLNRRRSPVPCRRKISATGPPKRKRTEGATKSVGCSHGWKRFILSNAPWPHTLVLFALCVPINSFESAIVGFVKQESSWRNSGWHTKRVGEKEKTRKRGAPVT